VSTKTPGSTDGGKKVYVMRGVDNGTTRDPIPESKNDDYE